MRSAITTGASPTRNPSSTAEMMASGAVDVQSHTYDMHQWSGGETKTPVRESALQFDGESDADYMEALAQDISIYQEEYTAHIGKRYNVLSYPQGLYSVLSEVVAAQCGIEATITTEAGRKNTLVKGLPQTLRALSRFNVTEETTDEQLLADLAYQGY